MDTDQISHSLLAWATHPLISLGDIEVSMARIVGLLVIILSAWWIAYALEHTIRRVASRSTRLAASASSVYTWARVMRYVVWIFGTLIGLNYIGINLASFALVGGAIGVGIGFGLQTIFSNFISGLILLLEKTLKVGDFVDLESGVRGHVREIGLRYTRITTNDDVDIIVPNSEFINGRVVNWTFNNRLRRMRIPFGVAYGTDKLAVREAGLKAARRLECTFEDDSHRCDVWLIGMGESSLDFALAVWVGPDYVARPANTEARYLWAIHDELCAAGIEIPFPQRDLNVRSGTLQVRVMPEQTPAPAPVEAGKAGVDE